MRPQWFLFIAALSGFTAVALGAFGAHGLRSRFAALSDGAQRLGWWDTAANYQLVHSVALGLVAVLLLHAASLHHVSLHSASLQNVSLWGRVAAFAFIAGIVLFSGSLYTMSLTGLRVLGAVTPFGGLAFLLGWAALAVAAVRWGS